MATKLQIEELKAVQSDVQKAQKVCNEISTKLAEVENAQSAVHLAAAEIPKLENQKKAFLADLVLGKSVKQSEIDQITAQIAKAISEVERHEQIVSGLNTKLLEAQSTYSTLTNKSLLLKRSFVEQEGVVLHAEYITQAKALLTTFRRLCALSTLSQGIGGNPFGSGNEHMVFSIPEFRYVTNEVIGLTTDMANPVVYAHKDEDAERSRLVNMGILI